jgi:opacity protein-like surface antigen
MKKLILLSFLTSGILQANSCPAADLSSVHLLGLRMGFWNAPQAKNVQTAPGEEILSKVTAPYGEFFASIGLRNGFAVEISLGSNYRGETRYNDRHGYYWKRVSVYPISGQMNYYPLFSVKKSRWQPYLGAGIGLVSGVENLRLGEYAGPLVYVESGTNSYLTFGWHAGGGIGFVLTRHLVICADFKYRGVKFGDKVGGLKDFSGPEAAFGVAYVLKGT